MKYSRKSIALLGAGVLCCLSILAVLFLRFLYRQIVVTPVQTGDGIVTRISPTPDPLRPIHVLLLGYGGGRHDGGLLTDTIIVARIAPKEKKVTLISVPRDTWVPLMIQGNETIFHKLNAAYAIGSDDENYLQKPAQYTGDAGGGTLAKDAIQAVTDLPIDYFVAVSFDGFVRAVDTLGGVDIAVTRPFIDEFYPIEGKETDSCGKTEEEIQQTIATLSGELRERAFVCRFERLEFLAGKQHMDGITALKYVRSRHSLTDGGDYNRSDRQRALLKAVREKVFQIGFLPKILPLLSTFAGTVSTDIDANTFQQFIERYGDINTYTMNAIALTEDNVLMSTTGPQGQYILTSRAGQDVYTPIHEYIRQQLSATSSAIPK